MILPMLAESEKMEKKKTQYWLEPKFDGMRLIIQKEGSKVRSWSRTGKPQNGKLPHIEELLRDLPFDFILDGEIARPVKLVELHHEAGFYTLPVPDFTQTMEVMGSGVEQAVWKQEMAGGLVFLAFDCLGAMGHTVLKEPYIERRLLLARVWQQISKLSVSLGLSESWAVYFVPAWVPGSWTHNTLDEFVTAGFEGGVLKDPEARYYPGQRSPAFIKRKHFQTADVFVTGYKEGAGKFAGVIGAIEFGQYVDGKPLMVGSCSGMDDELRWEISKNRGKYMGRVFTIKYFGMVGKAGNNIKGYRHPQFLGFRDDKPRKECIYGQD